MGRRHLTEPEAVAALRRGRQIEQWLGAGQLSDATTAITWLSAAQRGRSFALVRHHVRDVGTAEYADLSTFPPVDEEEEFGEGRVLTETDDPQRLLRLAEEHGADGARWVTHGVVQDEYRDFRRDLL